jgi:hypothetical protein
MRTDIIMFKPQFLKDIYLIFTANGIIFFIFLPLSQLTSCLLPPFSSITRHFIIIKRLLMMMIHAINVPTDGAQAFLMDYT